MAGVEHNLHELFLYTVNCPHETSELLVELQESELKQVEANLRVEY